MEQLLIFGLPGLLGLYFAYSAFGHFSSARAASSVPTRTVSNVSEGLVEVQGTAKASRPLTSPVKGTPCVYYRYKVERLVQKNRGTKWETVDQGSSDNFPFLCDDGTGEIEIYAQGAEFFARKDHGVLSRSVTNFGSDQAVPAEFRNVLGSMGKSLGSLVGGTSRVTEELLMPGDALYVLGAAFRTADGKWGIRKGPSAPFVLSNLGESVVVRQLYTKAFWEILGAAGVAAFLWFYVRGR
ncbi:MAG: hypothetical protein A2X94_17520 [Bdellovibrionales bacterium GWB1_55_8]|nr:MAG: hypothetical protein A2X94_17520 [Bdellovibrionales bacterium GWB1_55_8]